VKPLVIDIVLALVVTAHGLSSLEPGAPLAAALVLPAGTLALIWRHRAPLVVLAVSGTVFLVLDGLGYASPWLPFAPAIALYTVAATRSSRVSSAAMGVLAAAGIAAAVAHPGAFTEAGQYLDYLIALAASWTVGYGARLNSIRTAQLERQAAQLRLEQEHRTQQAVAEEQARIARELHDIVTHNVSIIVAQAGATRRVADVRPDLARKALDSIETVGRAALAEMRLMLGLLWTSGGEAGAAAQPGLRQLPTLVEHIEQAGLPVELQVRGEPRPLPAGVELNAYRIIQEALTNTLRHAGPTSARVQLEYQAEFIELRIRDQGRGRAAEAPTGQGLAGMRQRADMLGGEVLVTSGPGGFEVTAKLPVNGGQL
jgi:signal transduction histidine kinase